MVVGLPVCVMEAVTVEVRVASADPDAVIDAVIDDVTVFDVVLCAVADPLCDPVAVPVFDLVAAAVLEAVGLLLAVTVGVTMPEGELDPDPVAVSAADCVCVELADPV